MNNIIITKANLARDPELRYTQTQKAVCNFSIADNYGYGEKKQVSFFNIVAWGKVAENCNKFLKKGSQINLQGRLSQRKYTSKDGQNKSVIEIVAVNVEFVNTKNKEQSNNQNPESVKVNESPEIELPDFGDEPLDENGDVSF